MRDGVFEVLDDFYSVDRGIERLRFSHILVECKNYKKPSYRDLMQVYAYTLLNRIYPIVNKPLCLLASRENPAKDSVISKMRNKLFEVDGGVPLLILFLSCDDLREMAETRKKGGDPFIIIKEQLREIQRDNITAEI
jgi:uncharacterized protein YbaR (Trm112 family)